MHTDEAVHAIVIGEMFKTGVYRYNPGDSHGPLLYFITYPVLSLLGINALSEMEAWQLRLFPALTGSFMILSLALWRPFISPGPLLVAACLLGASAPLIYYQRYFIHESLFVLLSLVSANLVCRLFEVKTSRLVLWAWLGTVLGLLFSTKETAAITCLALIVAASLVYRTDLPRFWSATSFKTVGAFLAPFFAITVLLYSSFGLNPHGLLDLVVAPFRYAHRAGGEGHEKPFWTYVVWLLLPGHFAIPWSGVSIVLAIVSLAIGSPAVIRFIAIYGLVIGIIYSAIPYKTPWLELNILAPALLPAAHAVCQLARQKLWVIAAITVIGTALLIRETITLCFVNPNDDRNPLAYSPTATDVLNLEAILKQYPGDTKIAVISADYWPLPWYLRRFSAVGYWNEMPKEIPAQVVLTSPELLSSVLANMPPGAHVRYYGLRPEVLAILVTPK